MGVEQQQQSPSDPHAIIPERVAATRWMKSLRTLQRWRAEGYGPAYLRIGGAIFYRLSDIHAFEESHRHGGPPE